jgi:hypothetical protein
MLNSFEVTAFLGQTVDALQPIDDRARKNEKPLNTRIQN